jgi:hypothetical protein
LGDAELIVELSASGEADAGHLECWRLDGGHAAFELRRRKCGI